MTPCTMPPKSARSPESLARLDARHDELLERLDDLNQQIEAALAEFARVRRESLHESDPDASDC